MAMDPNYASFMPWARSNAKRFWAIVLGLPAVTILSDGVQAIQAVKDWMWFPFILTSVQFLVLFCLLFTIPRGTLAPKEPRESRLNSAVEWIELYWRLTWMAWALEYLALAGHDLYHVFIPAAEDTCIFMCGNWLTLTHADVAIHVLLNLLNNLTSLFLLLCAWMMAEETIKNGRHNGPVVQGVCVVIIFSALDLLFFLGSAYYPHLLPGWWKRGWYFEIGSGFLAGTITAMMVGRLDSKVIGLPRSVLLLLYAYASLQLAWPLFEYDYVRPLALGLAFICKVVLYCVMYWMLKYGIMALYGNEVIKMMNTAPGRRRKWLATL